MAKYRGRSQEVAVVWWHAITLLGVLLAGGGLLFGAWGLMLKEQETQRGKLSYLTYRAAQGRLAGEDGMARVLEERYGRTTQVHWGYVVGGLLAFAGGGYLAGVGLLAINRQWSRVSARPSAPIPGWLEESLEKMEGTGGKGTELA